MPESMLQPSHQTPTRTHPSPDRLPNSSANARPAAVSKFGRILKPNPRYLYTNTQISAYKTSLEKLLQDDSRSPAILKSIKEEVDNLMAEGIMEPRTHLANVIRLWLFHKEKLDANGKFLKDKSRIVTLSQSRDTSNIGLTYSPTVNPISLFVLLAIVATFPDHLLSAYDIKGAFLNSKIPTETHVYVRADKDLAKWFLKFYPHLSKTESPVEWNKTINEKLTSMGFIRAKADPCLYTMPSKQGMVYLTVHVDDMILASPTLAIRT
jgi:hypothetical protein